MCIWRDGATREGGTPAHPKNSLSSLLPLPHTSGDTGDHIKNMVFGVEEGVTFTVVVRIVRVSRHSVSRNRSSR
jgi:hypothetical protein